MFWLKLDISGDDTTKNGYEAKYAIDSAVELSSIKP